MIPYGRQTISEDDIKAVTNVLRSDFLTQGLQVPKFEGQLSSYCNVTHAVAVNSATSALHIACMALGLSPGDSLWTTPITFVASANCARYCGASVDFVDIDPVTLNLCPVALKKKLEIASRNNTLPKVIIPVHFSGQPCDLKKIFMLAKEYGIRIIEDASHALGASYENTAIGSCLYSDITIFSFHPVKIITTGEGGMCVTRSEELANLMRLMRSHGITKDHSKFQLESGGDWLYEQQLLGFNYRMTDIHAALGLSQLSMLDEWVERRHCIARRYDTFLAELPIILPMQNKNSRSALHLYVIQVDEKNAKINRNDLFDKMRASDIGVNVHYIPVHLQPYYRALGFKEGDYPNSERYYQNCLSLPMYPSLTKEQQDSVVSALRKFVE